MHDATQTSLCPRCRLLRPAHVYASSVDHLELCLKCIIPNDVPLTPSHTLIHTHTHRSPRASSHAPGQHKQRAAAWSQISPTAWSDICMAHEYNYLIKCEMLYQSVGIYQWRSIVSIAISHLFCTAVSHLFSIVVSHLFSCSYCHRFTPSELWLSSCCSKPRV